MFQWAQSNIDMVLYKLKGVLGSKSKDEAMSIFKAKDSKVSGSLIFNTFRYVIHFKLIEFLKKNSIFQIDDRMNTILNGRFIEFNRGII